MWIGLAERGQRRLERGLGQGRDARGWCGRSPRAWPRGSGPPRTRGSARWPRARRCARRGSRRCALSATTLTKPSVSPSATALPLAVNGNLPDRDLAPARAGRRLGEPDRGDLRAAVGAGRDVAVVHRPRATGPRSPPRPRRPRPSPCGRAAGGPPCRRSRRCPSPRSPWSATPSRSRARCATPSASSPSPRVRAARPTAISTWSALSVSVLPSASTSTDDPGAARRHRLDLHAGADRDAAPARTAARSGSEASSSSMGSDARQRLEHRHLRRRTRA